MARGHCLLDMFTLTFLAVFTLVFYEVNLEMFTLVICDVNQDMFTLVLLDMNSLIHFHIHGHR